MKSCFKAGIICPLREKGHSALSGGQLLPPCLLHCRPRRVTGTWVAAFIEIRLRAPRERLGHWDLACRSSLPWCQSLDMSGVHSRKEDLVLGVLVPRVSGGQEQGGELQT